MGSCFSKSETPKTSERTAGRPAAKPKQQTAPVSVPLKKQTAPKNTYNSPGHTLGGAGESIDAKEAAARAAEARAESLNKGGKLSQQLAQEKAQKRTELMRNDRVDEPLVFD